MSLGHRCNQESNPEAQLSVYLEFTLNYSLYDGKIMVLVREQKKQTKHPTPVKDDVMSGNAGRTLLLLYDDDATFTKRERGLNVGESRVFAIKAAYI